MPGAETQKRVATSIGFYYARGFEVICGTRGRETFHPGDRKSIIQDRSSEMFWFGLVWWRVLRPEWSYTAGLLSLLGEPPNAADHGATVCLGIASPKP